MLQFLRNTKLSRYQIYKVKMLYFYCLQVSPLEWNDFKYFDLFKWDNWIRTYYKFSNDEISYNKYYAEMCLVGLIAVVGIIKLKIMDKNVAVEGWMTLLAGNI